METSTFAALALACAPQIHLTTAHALVSVESAFNPWAIGVVGGALRRQPNNRHEALATAHQLISDGRNFSVGLAQINVGNFQRLSLNRSSAFDPCQNLAAMQAVLMECFDRAAQSRGGADTRQSALRKALSCYYSGNFSTGFRHGYVQKIVAATRSALPSFQPVIQGAVMNRQKLTQGQIRALSLLMLLPPQAWSQGFDRVNTTVTNVNAILVTISVAVVTIAIIWAGFKMIFQGARLADVANILIGGTLVGGAAAFASYIVN